MSGDLKHPSKAIPKGTLYGLGLTFSCYTLVILAMAATITRASFYRNVNVIQDVSVQGGPDRARGLTTRLDQYIRRVGPPRRVRHYVLLVFDGGHWIRQVAPSPCS